MSYVHVHDLLLSIKKKARVRVRGRQRPAPPEAEPAGCGRRSRPLAEKEPGAGAAGPDISAVAWSQLSVLKQTSRRE